LALTRSVFLGQRYLLQQKVEIELEKE